MSFAQSNIDEDYQNYLKSIREKMAKQQSSVPPISEEIILTPQNTPSQQELSQKVQSNDSKHIKKPHHKPTNNDDKKVKKDKKIKVEKKSNNNGDIESSGDTSFVESVDSTSSDDDDDSDNDEKIEEESTNKTIVIDDPTTKASIKSSGGKTGVEKVPKVKKSSKIKKQWDKNTMTLTELCVPIRNENVKERKRWQLSVRYREAGKRRLRSKRFKFGEERLIDRLKQLSNQIRDSKGDTTKLLPEMQKVLKPFRQLANSDNLLNVKYWKQQLLNTPLKMEDAFLALWRKLRKEGVLKDWNEYE